MSPAVHLKYGSVGLIRAYWSFKLKLPFFANSSFRVRLHQGACCFPKCLRFGIPYSYVRDPISIQVIHQAFSFHRVGLSRDPSSFTSENSYIYDSMMRCEKNKSGSINTSFLVPMRCGTSPSPQRRRRGRMPLESSFTIAFKLESPEVAWFV